MQEHCIPARAESPVHPPHTLISLLLMASLIPRSAESVGIGRNEPQTRCVRACRWLSQPELRELRKSKVGSRKKQNIYRASPPGNSRQLQKQGRVTFHILFPSFPAFSLRKVLLSEPRGVELLLCSRDCGVFTQSCLIGAWRALGAQEPEHRLFLRSDSSLSSLRHDQVGSSGGGLSGYWLITCVNSSRNCRHRGECAPVSPGRRALLESASAASCSQQMDPFDTLPAEIILTILAHCDDFTSPDSLLSVSPHVHAVFQARPRVTTLSLIASNPITQRPVVNQLCQQIALLHQPSSIARALRSMEEHVKGPHCTT
jgi:hypothetical protein